MKLQKSTLILFSIALLLGGGVYFYEINVKENQAIEQQKEQKVFNFAQAQIKGFKIERGEEILEFAQTGDDLLLWQMIKPEKTKANAGAISFLINALVGENIKQNLTISSSEKANYGLDKPLAKLTVTLQDNQSHKLIFGNNNFDEKFVYTLIDPPDDSTELTVTLLPINFKYAVERPLAEWK